MLLVNISCLIKKSFRPFGWFSEISQKLFNALDCTAMAFDLTCPPTLSCIFNEKQLLLPAATKARSIG
jgi:hypothetical protein